MKAPAKIADPFAQSDQGKNLLAMAGRLLILISLSLALLSSCGRSDIPRVVGMLEWDRLELIAEASEPIVSIAVKEGDRVTQGDRLLQLDPARLQARLDEARAARDQAAARLAELERGPRQERILEARAQLKGAERIYRIRERELERLKKLLARQLISPQAVDEARAARDAARAERDAAQARLAERVRGTTPEELEQARQALARAQAMLRETAFDLERLTVRAPQDGRVDTLPFKLGEQPPLGTVVAVMLAGETPYARVYIPEPIRARVAPEDPARVYVDGIEQPFDGTVRMVSGDPAFTPFFALTEHDRGRLSYIAKIYLEGSQQRLQRLPAGVPVEVVLTRLQQQKRP